MYFGKEDGNEKEDKTVSSVENTIKCGKLQLKTNIAAYINKKEIARRIEPMECNNNLIENVTSHYIIMKQILSNLLWQDKLICSTWHSAVKALEREQLSPEVFVIDMVSYNRNSLSSTAWLKQSGIFHTETLEIFTFANTAGFSAAVCSDLINHHINAPKNCMLSVKAYYSVYRPHPLITFGHTIILYKHTWTRPILSGIFIPKIPDVGFQVLNVTSINTVHREFYDKVKNLSRNNIIKGVLVYVIVKYILHSIQEGIFLNFAKETQPDVLYALGGGIIEDTVSDQSEIKQLVDSMSNGEAFISENLITISKFTVLRTAVMVLEATLKCTLLLLNQQIGQNQKSDMFLHSFQKKCHVLSTVLP